MGEEEEEEEEEEEDLFVCNDGIICRCKLVVYPPPHRTHVSSSS